MMNCIFYKAKTQQKEDVMAGGCSGCVDQVFSKQLGNKCLCCCIFREAQGNDNMFFYSNIN